VAKDLPLGAIVRHSPELLLGQLENLAMALRAGKLDIWLRVWRDALRGLPRMLRKRRRVQASRRIPLHALDALVDAGAGP
jgi:hypothetical protein